jgi:FlaA1/EpsC-like NDP-sugar epimerase
MNILITGATGTLGAEVVKSCLERGYSPVAIGHSEKRAQSLKIKFTNVPLYCTDILNIEQIENVVQKHNIDYVIHAAAMKNIGICENNPGRAIDVNIIGSRNIINACKKFEIKNMIAVSTDKAINPLCVYGCTKLLMERLVIENGYSIIQGVNFLFSSGSVLYLWDKAKKANKPLLVNTQNTTRYFIKTSEIANKILDSLNIKGKYIKLEKCYKVKLHDLAKAFGHYHGYNNFSDYYSASVEKITEEVPENVNIIETDIHLLKNLIKEHYGGY